VRFGFLLNEVLTGLRRNVTMTVAMILTTAISIGLFGGGLLVVRLADNSRNIYLDRGFDSRRLHGKIAGQGHKPWPVCSSTGTGERRCKRHRRPPPALSTGRQDSCVVRVGVADLDRLQTLALQLDPFCGNGSVDNGTRRDLAREVDVPHLSASHGGLLMHLRDRAFGGVSDGGREPLQQFVGAEPMVAVPGGSRR
jgi:hypothetical protein